MTLPAVPPVETAPAPRQISLAAIERLSSHRRDLWPIARTLESDPETSTVGTRMNHCATHLSLGIEATEDEQQRLHLLSAFHCKARLCPWCEWRRTLAWNRRICAGFEKLTADQPKLRGILLTLTVRNCPLDSLSATIAEMHQAWNRLTKTRTFPTSLWLRRTEVTLGKASRGPDAPPERHLYQQCKADLELQTEGDPTCEPSVGHHSMSMSLWAHPHIHALLLVRPGYWARGYTPQAEWQRRWQMAGRFDYSPVVDVRAVKARSGSRLLEDAAPDAIREVAKYITKSADVVKLGDRAIEMHHQLKGMRMIAVSTALQRYVKGEKISEAEMLDKQAVLLSNPHLRCAIAQWDELASTYRVTPDW